MEQHLILAGWKKKADFSLSPAVSVFVTVFHFKYVWNSIGMCWNFMCWEAKLINNERLVLLRKGVCNTQDTEQFSSHQMLARHTYFKSLMHHHCREEVRA